MPKKIYLKFLKNQSEGKLTLSKNIIISIFCKAISLIVSFVSVPLLLTFLGNEIYGIWLTVFSLISWMSFFDLGLGNGLRNYLTSLFVNNDYNKAQEYISTAYWYLSFFIIICLSILQTIVFFVDWNSVFRPSVGIIESFNVIMSICLWGFGFLLISKLITSVLQSKKKVGISDALISFGGLASLIAIFIISKLDVDLKLYWVSFVYTWIAPIVLIIFSIFYFNNKNKIIKPSFNKIKKLLAKDIFGLGLQFFLVQFLIIILNQSANIIITQVLSPSDVIIYYIPFRLFSIITILMGLISNNLLPYFTESYAQKDFVKMKTIIKTFFKILSLVILLFLVVLLFSEQIISIWTSNKIKVPFSLLILHMLLALISSANGIFSSFLSGIGKLKNQIVVLFISAVSFLFLSFYLGKQYGLDGIVISLIIVQLPILMVMAIQSKKILINKVA